MSPFYEITTAMWQSHIPTPPFMKPHMEITPHHQATQYFDGLLDMREEAIQFENARRGDYINDAIPRYKKDEKFMNFGHGHRNKTPPQAVGATTTTTITTPEAVGG